MLEKRVVSRRKFVKAGFGLAGAGLGLTRCTTGFPPTIPPIPTVTPLDYPGILSTYSEGEDVLVASQSGFISFHDKNLVSATHPDYWNVLIAANTNSPIVSGWPYVKFEGFEKYRNTTILTSYLEPTLYSDSNMQGDEDFRVAIFRVEAAWGENTLSANNRSTGVGSSPVFTIGENRPGKVLAFDLKEARDYEGRNPVEFWVAHPEQNHGIMLEVGNVLHNWFRENYRTFYSSRTAYPPRLRVKYRYQNIA